MLMAVTWVRAASVWRSPSGLIAAGRRRRCPSMCQRERSYGSFSRTSQPVGTYYLVKRRSCGPGAVLPCLLTSRRLSGLDAVGRLGHAVLLGARCVSSPSGEPLFALRQLDSDAHRSGRCISSEERPGEPERWQRRRSARCGLSPLGSLSCAAGVGLLPASHVVRRCASELATSLVVIPFDPS